MRYILLSLLFPGCLTLILGGSASAQENSYCKQFLAGDTASGYASVVFNNGPVQTADPAYGSSELAAMSWTAITAGTPGSTTRSLLYFNLKGIPAHAEIISAHLYLFPKQDNRDGNLGNPIFGSHNAFVLQRVNKSWNPAGVGWGGQPEGDGHMEKKVPDSHGLQNDTIDLKNMVQYWVSKPDKNYGMLLRLENEKAYNGAPMHPVAIKSGATRTGSLPLPAADTNLAGGIGFRLHSAKGGPAVSSLANSVIFYSAQAPGSVQPKLVVYYRLRSDMAMTLSPNPAYGSVRVDFNAPASGNALAEIVDINGRVVSSQYAAAVQGDNQLSFTNLSSLSNGIYFMKLVLNDNAIAKKFIIAH